MGSHGRDVSTGRFARLGVVAERLILPGQPGQLTVGLGLLTVSLGLLTVGVGGCGGGAGVDTCSPGAGEGMLMVNITGHDPGAVSVEGVAGLVQPGELLTLPAGPHAVTAARVTTAQTGITSRVFEGTVSTPDACVRAGATTIVSVTYAPIPTSGKLWVGVGNAPDDSSLLGFEPASVATTRPASAAVAANTGGSDGFTFDRAGNVWVLGGTTADPPLARYPARVFASDGVKAPDVVIESPSFGSAIPGPKVVAFDPAGNLWVSVVAADKVVMFTAAQIAANGAPVASVERSGLTSPQGLAFDSSGNLWVAAHDDNAVVRIDAAHLTASGTGGDLAITAMSPAPVILTLTPISLAFDAAGDLWVNYDGTLGAIRAADQSGTGTKTITPVNQIATDVSTLPVGIAFDQDGGLWLAHAAGQFARFSSDQLAAAALPPEIVITSPDVGYASWFAIYPAPAFTPLYHKVP
jgi:sugar lactone lactonase YvrE